MDGKLNKKLLKIYKILLKNYGQQNWWPADSFDEIIIGAILTQNTNWQNVEKAIINLKKADNCSLEKISQLEDNTLAKLIKPSGYFNVKAKRLKNTAISFSSENMNNNSDKELREKLLKINGIGPETADSILLYAFERTTFVIDTYTKRIFSRIGFLNIKNSYSKFQRLFTKNIDADLQTFNEYHALIVKHAKIYCKTKPLCEKCILKQYCSQKI